MVWCGRREGVGVGGLVCLCMRGFPAVILNKKKKCKMALHTVYIYKKNNIKGSNK